MSSLLSKSEYSRILIEGSSDLQNMLKDYDYLKSKSVEEAANVAELIRGVAQDEFIL